MFPISDSIKSQRFPFVTLLLILINVGIFIYMVTSQGETAIINTYALTPSTISFSNPASLLTFITSIFMHGGFLHILINMWFLWVFGDNVESHLGKVKFLLLYLLSGIAGNILQYAFTPASTIPILGASGAISGILASYLVLFPTAKIRTFIILIFFFSITEIPAMLYILYWFILQLFSGIASIPGLQNGGVAFWAHVGGFIAGLYLARRFKSIRTKRPDVIEGEIVE